MYGVGRCLRGCGEKGERCLGVRLKGGRQEVRRNKSLVTQLSNYTCAGRVRLWLYVRKRMPGKGVRNRVKEIIERV